MTATRELAPPLKLAAFGAVLAVAFVVALLAGNALPDLRDGGDDGTVPTLHDTADHDTTQHDTTQHDTTEHGSLDNGTEGS